MTWYKDLSECDYFANLLSVRPKAVGWLERGKPYTQGKSSEKIIEKLKEFINKKEITIAFLGVHECDLCEVELPENQLNVIDGLGSRITFVAHKGKLYLFPDLIIHYINKHSYLPPDEFVEAILNSKPQETLDYLNKIHREQINKKKNKVSSK